MSISKFSPAFDAAFLVVHCALAQTKTRSPEVGLSAPRAGAQGQIPLVTSTGAKMAAPRRELAASVVVIPKEILRARNALPLDDAISCASSPSPFDMSPSLRLRAALFANS